MSEFKLWTIGHGIVKRDDLLAKIESEVGEDFIVVDVRSFPASRFNPSCNKKAMIEALGDIAEADEGEDNGARYMHLPMLGGYGWVDKPDQEGFEPGKADREIADAKNGLRDAIREGEKFVLMCSENDVEKCHRKALSAEIAAGVEGCEVIHILARPIPTKAGKKKLATA